MARKSQEKEEAVAGESALQRPKPESEPRRLKASSPERLIHHSAFINHPSSFPSLPHRRGRIVDRVVDTHGLAALVGAGKSAELRQVLDAHDQWTADVLLGRDDVAHTQSHEVVV